MQHQPAAGDGQIETGLVLSWRGFLDKQHRPSSSLVRRWIGRVSAPVPESPQASCREVRQAAAARRVHALAAAVPGLGCLAGYPAAARSACPALPAGFREDRPAFIVTLELRIGEQAPALQELNLKGTAPDNAGMDQGRAAGEPTRGDRMVPNPGDIRHPMRA
jgi:hypothetical protein